VAFLSNAGTQEERHDSQDFYRISEEQIVPLRCVNASNAFGVILLAIPPPGAANFSYDG
jgi:hypothetical protein